MRTAPFYLGILVIFGDCENVRLNSQKVFLEVQAHVIAIPDHDLVDDVDCRHQCQLVVLRDRSAAFFVFPEDLVGGE